MHFQLLYLVDHPFSGQHVAGQHALQIDRLVFAVLRDHRVGSVGEAGRTKKMKKKWRTRGETERGWLIMEFGRWKERRKSVCVGGGAHAGNNLQYKSTQTKRGREERECEGSRKQGVRATMQVKLTT